MTGRADEAFVSFLLEDVILTLGTVRGALGWLASGADCPPAARAEGFARISRQIAALEDRARALWAERRSAPCPHPDADELANLFQPSAQEAEAADIAFRSRRARG